MPTPAEAGATNALDNPLGDRFSLQELQQVIPSARFRIRPRHVEAAEGVGAYHCASAFPVYIKISYKELLASLADFVGIFAEYRACQTILGIVRELDGVIEIAGLGYGQHRTEDLLLKEARLRIYVGDHGRLDEIPVADARRTSRDEPSLFLAHLYVIQEKAPSA